MWIADYAQTPGQQLIVAATDLLASHWQTAMSTYELGSLAALDAWVDPPAGTHAFHAAARAERFPVGPRPEHGEGDEAQQLMQAFNAARAGSVDPGVVTTLLGPLRTFYDGLVAGTWELMWLAAERERAWPEAPSVERRAREDRIAYAAHVAWMDGPVQGRRRARRTPRAAALRLGELEAAQSMCVAEEAIDDPLRMTPVLLAGKALAGEIIACEADRRERINNRNLKRPRVTLQTDEPCVMPIGKGLWWTRAAGEKEWTVERIAPMETGGSTIALVLQTNRQLSAGLPVVGERACFSELNTRDSHSLYLPSAAPWTHRPADSSFADPSTDIEHTDTENEEAA
ncbi:MAG TPA: hypothetical protein VLK58_07590 [Conexibacter sp.]|nr:hypothetical protein [Conexibacter sp.]